LIIGAGVVGLTSAILLMEGGWSVKIVAEKISPHVTSNGPAAIWEPYLSYPESKVLQWSKDALLKFSDLYKLDKSAGLTYLSGFDFGKEINDTSSDQEFRIPKWMELLQHRKLTEEEFPKGWKYGMSYSTFMIQMNHFMPWLMKRFDDLGGTIEVRKVTNITDLLQDEFKPQIIVNCCGLGAVDLLNDKDVHPIRGQILKVEAPWVKHFYFATNKLGDYAYILPRDDCVILGGTAQKGEWDTSVDEETSRRILERCERILPGISKSKIIEEWVGLRPGRTSIRLEREEMTDSQGRTAHVIHNYGHGGSGVTLSFGCAKEVVELANSITNIDH